MIIKNKHTRMAILPIGNTGFIETPNTTVKPPHYQNKYSNTLFHSIVHTYNADKTERRNAHYQETKQRKNSFEANHIDPY